MMFDLRSRSMFREATQAVDVSLQTLFGGIDVLFIFLGLSLHILFSLGVYI
jgi:hypothetical protein